MARKKRRVNLDYTKEELQAMLDAINEENATIHYKPTKTQEQFQLSPIRYKLAYSGNRGGKTAHIAAGELAPCLLRTHPIRSVHCVSGVYLLIAPSLEQLHDPWGKSLLEQSRLYGEYYNKPLIPASEIAETKYSAGQGSKVLRYLKMKNGHELITMPSGDSTMWNRLEGKTLLGVVLDESAGTQDLIEELLLRVLDANSHDGIIKEAGGGWICWGATDTKFNEGYDWFQDKCNNPKETDFASFYFPPEENPSQKKEEREKLRSVLGEEKAAIRLDGTGTSLGIVQIYGEQWDDKVHISPTSIPERDEDNLWVAYDPGVEHPTGIICCSISPNNPEQIRIHRFFNHKRKTVEYDLELIQEWLNGRWLEGFVMDPAAKKTEKSGNSVASQIMVQCPKYNIHVKRGFQYGYNRHAPGIAQVRRYLTEQKLLVDPEAEGCGLFCYQMRKYRGKPETNFTGPGGVVKKEDEGPDCIRYLISKYPKWSDRGPNPIATKPINPTLPQMVKHPELVPEDISPEMQLHIERLGKSAQIITQVRPNTGRGGRTKPLF